MEGDGQMEDQEWNVAHVTHSNSYLCPCIKSHGLLLKRLACDSVHFVAAGLMKVDLETEDEQQNPECATHTIIYQCACKKFHEVIHASLVTLFSLLQLD